MLKKTYHQFTIMIVIVIVAFASIGAIDAAKGDKFRQSSTSEHHCATNEIDKLDELSARFLSLTKFQRRFPESAPQVDAYCKLVKNDLGELSNSIGRCLAGTAKHFGSVILYSYRTAVKQYCGSRASSKSARRRAESMTTMAACMNRNEAAGNQCLNHYIEALQRGKRAEPRAARIGYACCDYFKFLNCLENLTKDRCTERQSEKIQEFVRAVFAGIVDVACGDYTENSDKCDKLAVPPKKLKTDRTYRTYFLPLVELWHSL